MSECRTYITHTAHTFPLLFKVTLKRPAGLTLHTSIRTQVRKERKQSEGWTGGVAPCEEGERHKPHAAILPLKSLMLWFIYINSEITC